MQHLILGDKLHTALNALSIPKFDMIDWQQSTESTNNDCKLWAERGAVRALSISNHQSAGRGQSNRVWQSPRGNVYLSFLTNLPKPLDGRLALEVGLALVNMPILQNLDLSVKWPNDLYARGAKWGGILIEPIHSHNMEHGAVLGVGINLQPMQDYVADRTVTDLTTLLGHELDHVQLAAAVIQAVLRQVPDRQPARPHDGPVVRLIEAGKHAQQGRLAGTVRAGQPHPLAPGDLPGHALEQDAVDERFGQARELDHA